jgi:aminoglycoside phosphotransferase (APT) family kinase protein
VSAIVNGAADPGIPTLAAVLDPVALGRMLDEVLPVSNRGLQDLQIRVLRYHPRKRCVFETAGRSPNGPRSWIGKVYAVDRADVYHAMAAIRLAGFGPDAAFSIPEPVAYLPESRLLLQENVAGRSATDLFLSDDVNDRLRMSERCAEWLARFHTVAPRSGPTFDLGSYQLSIDHWSRRIAGVGGAFADTAGELRRQLEVAVSRLRDVGTCPSHGSLSHHQVIVANGRTVTFDWDHHAVADPAFDVARFVVYLRRLALRCLGSVRALDAAADAFLNTYLSTSRREVRGNLPFYAAAICLRLAKNDIRHQGDRWSEKAEATLDEGLRFLEQGV